MQNIFLAIFFLIIFLFFGRSSTSSTSGSSPSSNRTSSPDNLARINQLLEKSNSELKSKDCEGALKSANQAVGLDSNNAKSYFSRGLAQFTLAYSCGNNQNPDVTLLRKAIDDLEKSARIFESTSDRENAQIASKLSSNIQKSIKSIEEIDKEADEYFRTIFSNLSSLKFKYGKYGGEITNLTLWNRLSAQEKIAYGKAFCKWERGQKLYDVVTIASAFGGKNNNPLKAGMGESPDFDTLAEASTIISSSMIVFCKDKYSLYLFQQSSELLK